MSFFTTRSMGGAKMSNKAKMARVRAHKKGGIAVGGIPVGGIPVGGEHYAMGYRNPHLMGAGSGVRDFLVDGPLAFHPRVGGMPVGGMPVGGMRGRDAFQRDELLDVGGYRLGTRLSQEQKGAVKLARQQAKLMRAQGTLAPARRRNPNLPPRVRARAPKNVSLKQIKTTIKTFLFPTAKQLENITPLSEEEYREIFALIKSYYMDEDPFFRVGYRIKD